MLVADAASPRSSPCQSPGFGFSSAEVNVVDFATSVPSSL
jgi:hypothetical protein